jgi:putative transposase
VSRYRFIAAEKATDPVGLLCRTLGVSRQSFSAWANRGSSTRERADQQLLAQITTIHGASRGPYGAPGVHAELRDDYGVRVGRKRVARLMRTAGLVGCHRRRRRGLTRPDPRPPRRRTWLAVVRKLPTSSFFLVSTLTTGCPSARWTFACSLR